jgi:hypothetical protein
MAGGTVVKTGPPALRTIGDYISGARDSSLVAIRQLAYLPDDKCSDKHQHSHRSQDIKGIISLIPPVAHLATSLILCRIRGPGIATTLTTDRPATLHLSHRSVFTHAAVIAA